MLFGRLLSIFIFFPRCSAIVWWLSNSIEHVFKLRMKCELARFFTINQPIHSCQWDFFLYFSFGFFFVFKMKCPFVYMEFFAWFACQRIASGLVSSRLISLCLVIHKLCNFIIATIFFHVRLWFYRQRVNETNKTQTHIHREWLHFRKIGKQIAIHRHCDLHII